MKPLAALGNLLHRTPWWALVLSAVVSIGVTVLAAIPRNTIELELVGEASGLSKVFRHEVENAYERETLRALLRAASKLRPSITPEMIEHAEAAIDDLQEAKIELKAARAALKAAEAAGDPEEIDASMREVEALTRRAHSEGARIGRMIEQVFGGSFSIDATVTSDDIEGPAVGEASPAGAADTAPSLPAARKERAHAQASTRPDGSTVIERGDRTIIRQPDGVTIIRKPGKEVRYDRQGSLLVKKQADGDDSRTLRADPGSGVPALSRPAPPPAPAPPAPPAEVDIDGKAGKASVVRINGRAFNIDHGVPDELRAEISQGIRRDIVRMGFGALMLPVLLIMFGVLFIVKFLVDRSRAATRLAELKITEAEFHRMQQQIAQAKLSALQAQVEPHFLYNTLANVQALTEVDAAAANRMVGHLIEYLRAALPKMRESVSSIGQEVDLVRAYLSILQMRMGKRLSFAISAPQSLLGVAFPPLMLPSLVENAIKHGLEPLREGGSVLITVSEVDGRLRVACADTGRGLSVGESETAGGGVGLANIRERLKGLYGEEAMFTLEANSPKGVVATLEVPLAGPALTGAVAKEVAAATVAQPLIAAAEPSAARRIGRQTWAMMTFGERVWRRILSWSFGVYVFIVAAIALIALVGVGLGEIPIRWSGNRITGVDALPLAIPMLLLAFVIAVLAGALLMAVGYGAGIILVIVLAFVLVMGIVSALPGLAAAILVVGAAAWWISKKRRSRPARTIQSEA